MPVSKELETADWDIQAAEKSGYPFFMIKEIHEEFTNLINEKNNMLVVDVISASKLDDNQIKNLEVKLSEYYGGRHISINPLIDEKLIGGIKVIANGKSIDLSLNSKLQALKDNI